MTPTRWLTWLSLALALAAGGCTPARASDDPARAAASASPRVASVAPKPVAPAQAAPVVAEPQPVAPPRPSPEAVRACQASRAALATELAAGELPITRPVSLGSEQLACLTLGVAGLEPLAGLAPFDDDAIDRALRRGQRSRGAIHVWHIEPAVFAWAPVPEQRLLVISGQVGKHGAISVLRLAADGSVEHLSSIMLDEDEPGVALGSSTQYPRNLLWTTCYECPGAGGNIRFEDDASVSFLYR